MKNPGKTDTGQKPNPILKPNHKPMTGY